MPLHHLHPNSSSFKKLLVGEVVHHFDGELIFILKVCLPDDMEATGIKHRRPPGGEVRQVELKSYFTKLQLLWSKPGLKENEIFTVFQIVFKHGVFPDLFLSSPHFVGGLKNKKKPRNRWKAVLWAQCCKQIGGKPQTDRIFPPFGGASSPRLASWSTGNPPKWRAVEEPMF